LEQVPEVQSAFVLQEPPPNKVRRI
jgi:hypothetical protein